MDLDSETAQGFYEGIANQALWLLFHHFPSQVRFDWPAIQAAHRWLRFFSIFFGSGVGHFSCIKSSTDGLGAVT